MHMLPALAPALALVASLNIQPAGKHHASVKLVPETLSIAPGSTVHLFATFKIDDKWHLYWDGQNDTGQPPKFKWKLPDGWTISEPEFPAPRRNIQPGGIVDYIYEHQLILTFTLTAPKDTSSKSAKIEAEVEWLECADTCMFGAGRIETVLPIQASDPKPSPAAKVLQDRLKASKVSPLSDARDASITIQKDAGVIKVPGAIQLEYFPGNGSSTPKVAESGTVANGETLRVEFDPKGEPVRVNGIIAVYRTKPGPPAYYWAKSSDPAATEPAGKSIKKDK